MTAPGQRVRHDRLTNAALAASFGTRPTQRGKRKPRWWGRGWSKRV